MKPQRAYKEHTYILGPCSQLSISAITGGKIVKMYYSKTTLSKFYKNTFLLFSWEGPV